MMMQLVKQQQSTHFMRVCLLPPFRPLLKVGKCPLGRERGPNTSIFISDISWGGVSPPPGPRKVGEKKKAQLL